MEILIGEYKAKSIRFLINDNKDTEFYYDKDIGSHLKYDKVIIKNQDTAFNAYHFKDGVLISNRVYFYSTLKYIEFTLDEKITEEDIY